MRQRLAIAAALAVAVTVAVASVVAYVAVQARLRADIDDSLRDRAALVSGGQAGPFRPRPARVFDRVRDGAGPAVYQQLVHVSGATTRPAGGLELDVDDRTLEVAAGTAAPFLSDQRIDGSHLRVIAAQIEPGVALQVARPLDEADALLSGLRAVLIIVTLAGVAIAAALGWLISGRALRPVRRFTERTEAIAGAADLDGRLEETGDDELGRLARSFNTTLDALARSVETQRRLVADASHELRTPLASMRTNIEVLQRGPDLPALERDEILRDLVEQSDELTNIVADVVDAARRGEPADVQEVRADRIVAGMVERTRRIAPRLRVEAQVEPWVVMGAPDRLARMVANLLDNAAKWSPPGGLVEVRLAGGELTVRDHGPGIPEEDLPRIFDRFYRATEARSLPGSGLGLAIVRQVAEVHGGRVEAENAPGGGALFRVVLPGAPPAAEAVGDT